VLVISQSASCSTNSNRNVFKSHVNCLQLMSCRKYDGTALTQQRWFRRQNCFVFGERCISCQKPIRADGDHCEWSDWCRAKFDKNPPTWDFSQMDGKQRQCCCSPVAKYFVSMNKIWYNSSSLIPLVRVLQLHIKCNTNHKSEAMECFCCVVCCKKVFCYRFNSN